MYYIYWDSEDERWGAFNQQAKSSSPSAAAVGTPTPPAMARKDLTATTPGHRTSSPPGLMGDPTTALASSFQRGLTGDRSSSGGVPQHRSNSLPSVTDAPILAAAATAAAAAAAPCPLFVRFEVVHDETMFVDGEDNDGVDEATAAAAAAAAGVTTPGEGEAQRNTRIGDASAGSGGSNSSHTCYGGDRLNPTTFEGLGQQQGQQPRRRNRGCVVDTSHSLSRALKTPDLASHFGSRSPPWGVDRLVEEKGIAHGGRGVSACADGGSLSGPQTHLRIFATTFLSAELSKPIHNASSSNSGGSGCGGSTSPSRYSSVKVNMVRWRTWCISCCLFSFRFVSFFMSIKETC